MKAPDPRDAPAAPHLLVVDDEAEICEVLAEYFREQGFDVSTAHNAALAREHLAARSPGIVILDLRMPGEDGLSLASWIRNTRRGTGIVMLTTADSVVDRVVGLEVGADDYVPKPFDPRELLARVRSVWRRLQPQTTLPGDPPIVQFGDCQLNLESRTLSAAGGREIPLTSMEFDLLQLFANNPNRVLNRDQMMELAHHRGWEVFDRSIDLRVMRLRRKIEPDPDKPRIIKTIRGAGYMFVPQK
ncbi:MAG TPA: response regulator [Steroidobacteraceae bacterium]|nr:response regulator [Steroidobacteraceae bacterium]